MNHVSMTITIPWKTRAVTTCDLIPLKTLFLFAGIKTGPAYNQTSDPSPSSSPSSVLKSCRLSTELPKPFKSPQLHSDRN